jgi:predicted Zn finger-like uncharacterized protein
MILTCPNCGTRFRVDPAALAPGGKMVRCSQCGHRWFAEPPRPEPDAGEPVSEPVAEPIPEPPAVEAIAARTPRVPSSAAMVGWLVLLLVVLLLVGLVVGRNEIVAAFPQTALVYARLGLPVALPIGLEFRNLSSRREVEDGTVTLVVEGEIHNLAGTDRLVPPVRVSLLDKTGRELDFGLFDPPQRALPPGGMTRFEARLLDPPEAAETFVVTFADTPQRP